MMNKLYFLILLILVISLNQAKAQIYPDQFYVLRIDSIISKIEESQGIKISNDGKSIVLQDSVLNGYFILSQQVSQYLFNHGLPSWNGSVTHNSTGFKVEMRFPYSTGWSPWLTVGYWKNYIWSSYGTTSFAGGMIDYDYVKLNYYTDRWQFRVSLVRFNANQPSPKIHKLSFFVSDSRTTANISQIVADNPPQIFIPTNFIYQYGVDPTIGGSICSPTTVAMILASYGIQVDPYQFALVTKDPYFNIFGIWPRVVQHAAEYGLDGAVTRYRTWSEAYQVIANGGRIGMSLGSPLYPNGHLVMLAGFTGTGNPIVHDPAKSNGYSYQHNKTSLSQSWFSKGGVAYTFYPDPALNIDDKIFAEVPSDFELYQNYPNPFNPVTIISWSSPQSNFTQLKVYDILGNEVAVLVNEFREAGNYIEQFDANKYQLSSGVYFYQIQVGNFVKTNKMILMK
jgi:hypothetical protein